MPRTSPPCARRSPPTARGSRRCRAGRGGSRWPGPGSGTCPRHQRALAVHADGRKRPTSSSGFCGRTARCAGRMPGQGLHRSSGAPGATRACRGRRRDLVHDHGLDVDIIRRPPSLVSRVQRLRVCHSGCAAAAWTWPCAGRRGRAVRPTPGPRQRRIEGGHLRHAPAGSSDVVGERAQRGNVEHLVWSARSAPCRSSDRSRKGRPRASSPSVGAAISVWRPSRISGQPSSWGAVGSPSRVLNQVLTAGWKGRSAGAVMTGHFTGWAGAWEQSSPGQRY